MLLRQSLLHGLSSDRGRDRCCPRSSAIPAAQSPQRQASTHIFTEQYGGDLRGPLPGAVALGQGGEGDAAFAAVAALASLVKLVEGVAGERVPSGITSRLVVTPSILPPGSEQTIRTVLF